MLLAPAMYINVPSRPTLYWTAPPPSTRIPSTIGTGVPCTCRLDSSNFTAHNVPLRMNTRCPVGSRRLADPWHELA